MSFFRDYASWAFDYVHKNADRLNLVNMNRFNIFFEQHLFYALARERGIRVNVLIKKIIEEKGYKYLGDFHDVPFNRTYLHLLGPFKQDEFTCIQAASKLRELYPEYYERIVSLFHDRNLRLSPCGFLNKGFPSAKKNNEQSNTHLKRLIIAAGCCPPDIEKEIFQRDFEAFYQHIISFLSENGYAKDLVKRDADAQHWYRSLFAEKSGMLNQVVVRCSKAEIIKSSFDWGGLFNQYYRVGVGYYTDLQIKSGRFFNLVVPEATDNGFSLYDISEIEHAILMFLIDPLSISEILTKMQIYFEDNVLQNHYQAYENFMLTAIKQLVIKKAIHPL